MLDSINILSGWSGDAVYYGSTSVNYGRLYYLDPTGSWTRTHHATTPGQYMSSSILAIALGDGTASTVGMLTRGYVRLDLNTGIGTAGSVNSFSTGSIVYVSGSVVGGLMSTVKPNIATNVVRVIGYCTPYNQLLKFDPASYFAVV